MHLITPQDARVSTTSKATAYLGAWGRIAGNTHSRGWVRQTVRQHLRLARTAPERRRVMEVWRSIHYLGRGQSDPIGIRQIRASWCLDLPALRTEPVPWVPAAAVTVRYALPGLPTTLGLQSPLQALEIARNFVADDLRWPTIPDLSPAVLREVVRRLRDGREWQEIVAGRVQWQPEVLVSWADPAAGHDGGLYRGAGAEFVGCGAQGKQLFAWPLR